MFGGHAGKAPSLQPTQFDETWPVASIEHLWGKDKAGAMSRQWMESSKGEEGVTSITGLRDKQQEYWPFSFRNFSPFHLQRGRQVRLARRKGW
jgi:hypothetical protein